MTDQTQQRNWPIGAYSGRFIPFCRYQMEPWRSKQRSGSWSGARNFADRNYEPDASGYRLRSRQHADAVHDSAEIIARLQWQQMVK